MGLAELESSNGVSKRENNKSLDLSAKRLVSSRYACKRYEYCPVEFDMDWHDSEERHTEVKRRMQLNGYIDEEDYLEGYLDYCNEYNDERNEYIENSESNRLYRRYLNMTY